MDQLTSNIHQYRNANNEANLDCFPTKLAQVPNDEARGTFVQIFKKQLS